MEITVLSELDFLCFFFFRLNNFIITIRHRIRDIYRVALVSGPLTFFFKSWIQNQFWPLLKGHFFHHIQKIISKGDNFSDIHLKVLHELLLFNEFVSVGKSIKNKREFHVNGILYKKKYSLNYDKPWVVKSRYLLYFTLRFVYRLDFFNSLTWFQLVNTDRWPVDVFQNSISSLNSCRIWKKVYYYYYLRSVRGRMVRIACPCYCGFDPREGLWIFFHVKKLSC